MKKYALAASFIAAAFISTPNAMAQCPAGLANPLYLIDGTNWAFEAHQDAGGDGAVGTFKATVVAPSATNPFYTGLLAISETENSFFQVDRLLKATGKYQVYADCSGGELIFNTGRNSFQFEFVFLNGRTQMFFVSDAAGFDQSFNGLFLGEHGSARQIPAGCPAGVTDPLTLMVGSWAFHAENVLNAAVGTFTAQIKDGKGYLTVNETTGGVNGVNRGQQFNGIYQVYSDCSGGELLFNGGLDSVQYEFVFSQQGSEIFMVSDSTLFISIRPLVLTVGSNGKANRL